MSDKSTNVKELLETLCQGECFRAVLLPIYDLANDQKVGYELLSRGPAGPYEMPDQFLDLSLKNDISTVVDLNCLKACIKEALAHKEKTRFHVNIFPSTLSEIKVEDLLAIFAEAQRRHRFCIEINEKQPIENATQLRRYIDRLREEEILIALDDVGSGQSSLESLIILEPDVIKIDRHCVDGVAVSKEKQKFLRSMLEIFDVLGADVIAEGVTNLADKNFLQNYGVKYGQGSFLT